MAWFATPHDLEDRRQSCGAARRAHNPQSLFLLQPSRLREQPCEPHWIVPAQELAARDHHGSRQRTREADQVVNRPGFPKHMHLSKGNAAMRKKLFRQTTLSSVSRRVDQDLVQ